jgi:acyl dehydratase
MPNLNLWSEYKEGMKFQWKFSISTKQMLVFSDLSSDYNPIHIDGDFSRSKGFDGVIVYGMLLSAQVSRLVGQELPDNNAILTQVKVDFLKPAYPNSQLTFSAHLANKSDSTKALQFEFLILYSDKTLARGEVSALWRL